MEFRGTPRFELLRHLGTGGMGSVYQVRDRQRGTELALKTLTGTGGIDLIRFKREFRSLSDLQHPNLVRLYELISEEELWFFTMELVDGVPFHAHVASVEAVELRGAFTDPRITDAPTVLDSEEHTWEATFGDPVGASGPGASGAFPSLLPPPNPARLRNALRQLGVGVQALHDSGHVHRDLKPSNVLVSPEGRVVILDFGLTKAAGAEHQTGGGISGTPAYMAPEQALTDRAQPAADWYAVGIMLYQALTGRVPFDGNLFEILVRKQNEEPPPPAQVNPLVDPALSELCVALLRRLPEERLTGAELLARLGDPTEAPTSAPEVLPLCTAHPVAFVGREAELAALEERVRRAAEGQLTITLVRGTSGIGKTCLVEEFLAGHAAQAPGGPRPVLLRGRCHERETVPYKAFDAIVDELSHELAGLDEEDLSFVLPEDIQYLAEIFPVLRRLRRIRDHRYQKPPLRDPKELRNSAFVALRELLGRFARIRPFTAVIDDLQWADRDSFALLKALIQQPGAPALAIFATCRPVSLTEEGSIGALLEALQAQPDVMTLELGPLPAASSLTLAERLLADAEVDDPALRERIGTSIASEAGGNPFFVAELVRYLRVSGGTKSSSPFGADLDSLRLDRLIVRRLRALPDTSQRLLELLAVAGDPVPQSVLAEAAGLPLSSTGWQEGMSALTQERLVQQRGLRALDVVEAYHDRIREAVAASLDDAVAAQLHHRLAEAIEGWDVGRTDLLARHWISARAPDRAKGYVRAAAAEARAKLAFDRAAQLYHTALHLESDDASRPDLYRALGDCLAHTGRAAQAAEAYERAAALVGPDEALELRHLATSQNLRGGQIAKGLETLDGVLHTVGQRMAPTPRRALLSIGKRLTWLKVRGTRFTERPPETLSEADRRLLDVLWSANTGLSVVDTVRASDFLLRFLLKALEVGDVRRVAQGLAMLANQLAALGEGYFPWAMRMVDEADVLAHRVGDPEILGFVMLSRCLVRYFKGEFDAVADDLLEVEQYLLDHCQNVAWELSTNRAFICWSLRMSGRLKELSARFDQYLADAERTSDRYLSSNLRTYQSLVWLARDDPAQAAQGLVGVLDSWPKDMYQVQHLFHLYARCEQALYTDAPEQAAAAIRAERDQVERSGLLKVSGLRLEWARIQGRVALAQAEAAPPVARKPLLKDARRCARIMIAGEHQSAVAMGRLIDAGARFLTPGADPAAALTALEEAVATGDAALTRVLAACGRHWLGERRGRAEGRALAAEADLWLADQGVKNPPRLAHCLVPGFCPARGT